MVPSAEMADTHAVDNPQFMPFRLMNIIPQHVFPFLASLMYVDENFPPYMHGEVLSSTDLTIHYGYGFEGFVEAV